MPGEPRSRSEASAAKAAAAARTSPVLVPQGALEGQPEIPLNRPVTTVGSNENARLHLLSRTVSKGHAIFVNTGGLTYVADLASRTGVLVNGKLVRDVILKNGDRVQIGKFVFRYRLPPNFPQVVDAVQAPPAAVIVVGWPALPVTDRVVSIGRSDRSDIPLSDDSSVSAPHAVIFQAEGKWYIRDMGSRTGTHVNGKSIQQQSLNFGDRVAIGSSTILFQPGAMIEEASSTEEAEQHPLEQISADAPIEPVEPTPVAEVASEPIPLETAESDAEPPSIDWAVTPATDLRVEAVEQIASPVPEIASPVPEIASPVPEPVEVEHSEPDSAPIPLEEVESTSTAKIEPPDYDVESATAEPETISVEPVVAEPDAEPPIPLVESEPEPVTGVFDEPVAAQAEPIDVVDTEPPVTDEALPTETADAAAIPLEESVPGFDATVEPEPIDLLEEESSAVDWTGTVATERPGEPPAEHSVAEPADEKPAEVEELNAAKSADAAVPVELGPVQAAPVGAGSVEAASVEAVPAELVDGQVPAAVRESDDDLFDWSPTDETSSAEANIAIVDSEVEPESRLVDEPVETVKPAIETDAEASPVERVEETITPIETVATATAAAETVAADDSDAEIFDWSSPVENVTPTVAPSALDSEEENAPASVESVETDELSTGELSTGELSANELPTGDAPGIESTAIEPPADETLPETVPAETSWSGTPATELPAQDSGVETSPEPEHEPVPVDVSESSWVNEPTPPTPPSPAVIPPLPVWPGGAVPDFSSHSPGNTTAPVDEFVFVPTDEPHDAAVPDLLFFGDETHEVATDPVLVDRLEHSQAVSPDAAFDSAIEESLNQSAAEQAVAHQHELENRPAHFDPVVADAAFDAALEETFAGVPEIPAAVVPVEPVAAIAPVEPSPAPEVDELDDRVAHFNAALADSAFDEVLDETFAEQGVEPVDAVETHNVLTPAETGVGEAGMGEAGVDGAGVDGAGVDGSGAAEAAPAGVVDEGFDAPAIADHGEDLVDDGIGSAETPAADDAEPSWLNAEPTDPVDLNTLNLEDAEPGTGEVAEQNISWSSVVDEVNTPTLPPPAVDDSAEDADEEAIGWSALVSHEDLPAENVTTISDQAAGHSALISESADAGDLEFLEFPDEQIDVPTQPTGATTQAIEEPLIPQSTPVDELPPGPIEPGPLEPSPIEPSPIEPAPIEQSPVDDAPGESAASGTPPAKEDEPSVRPDGPAHGPSIFGFQFEGGSFLGGMPISLHAPEAPPVPVFDAAKLTPSGIGSMTPPPPLETPKPRARPLTVPRPALPTIGGGNTGKSMSGLVGEGNSTWAATPIIPPTGKPGEKASNRQRRGLTTAFNAPGMAARNADVFSQLANPIGVEVFAGKPPATVEDEVPVVEPTPEEPAVPAMPVAPGIAELPPRKKTRRSRLPWLGLLFVGIPAGLWALAYEVPQVSSKLVTAQLVGSLQFDGFTSLNPVDAHAFLVEQQRRLASDDVRLMAQQILENEHQPAGFTASTDDYSKTVDMQSLNWSGNTLQFTFNTNDPVAGSAQVNAVLAALAKRDHDLDDIKTKAKQEADDAHADADAAAARTQELSNQRRAQIDLAQDSPDVTTVSNNDQEAAALAQKWNDAKNIRVNSEALLADLRSRDASKPVDVNADPQIVELRKRLDPLREQIARLKGISAVAAGPGTSNAIPAGATTQPEGDVDPLLAPLQQQADALAKKLEQRQAELAPDASLTAAQREVDMTNRIENLSVKITGLRAAETQAKAAADEAAVRAKQNHDRMSAARLANVKAEEIYNQLADAENDHRKAVEKHSESEVALANCVTVAAVPIAPPTQFPASDIRAPMVALGSGISIVIFGLMIVGEMRRPKYRAGATPAAAPKVTPPPTPVIPWPKARDLKGLETGGQVAEPVEEQPPIVGEPDQVFGV